MMTHGCQGREEEMLVEGGELELEEGRGGRGEEASKGGGSLRHRWQ